MYSYCVATGEVEYIPPAETETYSDETGGFSPGYNPYAGEDYNGEDLVEPYYLDHGRTLVEYPYNNEMCRNTVYIQTTYTDSKTGIKFISNGTGFMIGPNAVATAGHIVYKRGEPDGDFFVGNATVVPAHNAGANSHPYGAAHATYFYCGGGWAYNGDYSDDWGIIELDTNIGNKTGWLGLQWQKSYKSGTSVRENGYPAEVNGQINKSPITGDRDQYIRYGTVKSSSKTNMLESTDMFASSGDSGGPCYIYSSDAGYTAIGIASYVDAVEIEENEVKDINSVMFRTIDKSLFEKLVKYRTSTL
ncbi:MAG: trypsin-like serine protease [Oscillospiraceae bacterium]|nr:trypsin-like serine protease [Oscillospiraceae bacterium]